MSDYFELQLVRGFQGLARRYVARMRVAGSKGEGSGQVFRKSAETPLLLQDGSGIIEACPRELCLIVGQNSLLRQCFVENRHLINQSMECAMLCVGRDNADPVTDGESDLRIV